MACRRWRRVVRPGRTRNCPTSSWPGSRAASSKGPAAAGYGEDQRWTLVRIVALIATMFHIRVSVTTAWQAMQRLGYTAQLPIHRAIERDEAAIAHWRRYQWPAVKESPPAHPPGSSLPTSVARR